MHTTSLPPFSHHRYRAFMTYVRWYMRRHFHALRLLGGDRPSLDGESVTIYTNHPGWWDPLIFLSVADVLYPKRLNYGPIDSASLGKYRFLECIGFFGIEPGSWKGSAQFLRYAQAASLRDDVIFWITSQGMFVDPRQRPVHIRPGVSHAAAKIQRGIIIPMAVEYPFWTERFPEALVAFGQPIRPAEFCNRSPQEWTHVLSTALQETQDKLAAAACRRNPSEFSTLFSGRVGVGGFYDLVRWIRARIRGESFDPAHVTLSVRDNPP